MKNKKYNEYLEAYQNSQCPVCPRYGSVRCLTCSKPGEYATAWTHADESYNTAKR